MSKSKDLLNALERRLQLQGRGEIDSLLLKVEIIIQKILLIFRKSLQSLWEKTTSMRQGNC